MNDKAIPRPVRRGPYVPVFRPEGDTYRGVDTPSFRKGTFYPRWIVNDFSAVRYRGAWHLIGITHPEPPGMTDEFVSDPATVHEAEYQLFHASAQGERFAELMHAGSFTEGPKILYPQMRPGERPDLWAPHALAFHDGIRIVYSPGEIRCADSTDFRSWQTGRVLFRGEDDFARDPFLYTENGCTYLLYVVKNTVLCRKSTDDMASWSEPFLVYESPFMTDGGGKASPESPYLLKRGSIYYLFWCIYDGFAGCYDHRTFVFAAETIDGFRGKAPITMLDAHAPEIVTDDDGRTFLLSVFYPENGVSAAELVWETGDGQ